MLQDVNACRTQKEKENRLHIMADRILALLAVIKCDLALFRLPKILNNSP
jgi:hypothetical protein